MKAPRLQPVALAGTCPGVTGTFSAAVGPLSPAHRSAPAWVASAAWLASQLLARRSVTSSWISFLAYLTPQNVYVVSLVSSSAAGSLDSLGVTAPAASSAPDSAPRASVAVISPVPPCPDPSGLALAATLPPGSQSRAVLAPQTPPHGT